MPSVTGTAVAIASGGLVQNLGPDDVYLGNSDVTTSNGTMLAAGESIAVGETNTPLYAVSSGTSDVRTLARATGIFLVDDPVE